MIFVIAHWLLVSIIYIFQNPDNREIAQQYATIVYNQSMPNMQPSNAKYAAIQCQICYTSGIVCTFGIGYEVKMALCAQMALYA